MWHKILDILKSVLPHYLQAFTNPHWFVKSAQLLLNIEYLYSDL